MITMIANMHRNPIIVDELLSSEQFGVDDAALMLLINSFSLLLYQSVPIVRGLVLQEWAQFSNGRVEKVKTEASRESGLVLNANGGEEPTYSRYKAATPSRMLRLTFYTTAGLVVLEIIMPALSATPSPRWKDLRGRGPYNRADKVAANVSALYNLT
ncbi:hypothetical protein ALC60_09295 [Trachymyrmex zeteki]|uniref:Uncharacterized protein n=1 Tax=Mycetomoellerius zeteki TaxID=64791 RepID=A0A151WV08_9HYME|nr:hypothetical protein ALC60_09295 [Trachymyrmex zeteki]